MKNTQPPERSIRLIRAPGPDGVGVLCLKAKKTTDYYTFREIPCAIGGRGFAVHRLGLGSLYHIRIGQVEECECECLGFLRHGHCKHISGLLALVRNGLL